MIAYALSGTVQIFGTFCRKWALFLLVLLGGLTVYFMPRLLLDRYFIVEEPPSVTAIESNKSFSK
jgi:hypothetical protein